MKVKKKKKKFKFTSLLVILLLLYIIGMIIYYFFTMPIKNITIKGNNLVKESQILKVAKVEDDSSLFRVSNHSLKKKITKNIPLVKDVKVKKDLFGNVELTIEENKILFYNTLEDNYHLSNNTTIKDESIIGYPTLVNYVPKEILSSFVKKLSKVDDNIIKMISEIEYSPDKHENVVLDEERFLLRMNDGNMIYINTVNIEKLNKYQTIYASLNGKGTLYLDSSSKNYIFETKKEEKKEIKEDEKPTNES